MIVRLCGANALQGRFFRFGANSFLAAKFILFEYSNLHDILCLIG